MATNPLVALDAFRVSLFHKERMCHAITINTTDADAVRTVLHDTGKAVLAGIVEDHSYEQFFFEKLSQLPGIQEVTSSIVLSDTKHTTVLPI